MATLVLLQAIQVMVRQAMGYFESAPDQSTLVELIKVLQTVTEGKVRVSEVFKVLLGSLSRMYPCRLCPTITNLGCKSVNVCADLRGDRACQAH